MKQILTVKSTYSELLAKTELKSIPETSLTAVSAAIFKAPVGACCFKTPKLAPLTFTVETLRGIGEFLRDIS
jgi:hypothetical protein